VVTGRPASAGRFFALQAQAVVAARAECFNVVEHVAMQAGVPGELEEVA